MRFYSGNHDGCLTHHDIALVERPDLPPAAAGWPSSGLDHVAIAMLNRETWLKQLAFLRSREIAFTRRVDRGATRSVHIADPNGHEVEILYKLPREGWERDIDAALNYGRALPTEGDEALVDEPEMPVFGTADKVREA
jgi:catechol 2,3-dioxygenase